MNLKLLMGCATFHILHAEELATADDMLAMLQSSLRVKQPGQDTEQQENLDVGLPDMNNIARLEEIVMARVREGKLFGDDKLSSTINASVKSMYAGIVATTAANQKTIIDDIKAFEKCKTTMWRNYDKAIPIERDHWIMGLIYPKCINAENTLKLLKQKHDGAAKTLNGDVIIMKKLAKAEEDRCGNICSNGKFENYHEQIEKLFGYYKTCKEKIGPRVKNVKDTQKKAVAAASQKKLSDAKYLAMKNKCLKIAYIMNQHKCKAVEQLDTSCSSYEECWKRAKNTYDRDAALIRVQEKNMKIQWRALHRIQCFLLVLNTKNDKDNKKEKTQLDKCIAIKRKDISIKHLDIDYKKIPNEPKCPRDPMCPCSNFYTNSYYKVGPKSRCVNNIKKNYICPACAKKKKR